MSSELLMLPVDEVKISDISLRKVNPENPEFLALCESVKSSGIINPINVRSMTNPETGEEYYILIDGLHRLTAAKEVGLEEIPCHVIEASEGKVLALQLQANLHRVQTKPVEFGKHLRRMMVLNPTITIADLANDCAVSTSYIQQRLSLGTLLEDIANSVDDGKITLSNGVYLAKLPPSEQVDWVEKAMTLPPNDFLEQCTARLREIKENLRQGKKPGESTFEPRAKLRNKAMVESELETNKSAIEICENDDQITGFRAALNWVLHLDEKTVKESREQWEAEQQKRKEELERKKKEAAAAKQKNAEKEAEELKVQLDAEG